MARNPRLLPALLLSVSGAWIASFILQKGPAFAAPGSRSATRQLRRTAVRGFKEDFAEWRGSLSSEERDFLGVQAKNEFNKTFRKSDDYSKDILGEDKMKSFSKVLGKFFDNEAEDYRKEVEGKRGDPNALFEKAGDKVMDMSLKSQIMEIDRDADRRYQFAMLRIREEQDAGRRFPQSSPLMEKWLFLNNCTNSHANNLYTLEFLKKQAAHEDASPELKAAADWVLTKGFRSDIPFVPATQEGTSEAADMDEFIKVMANRNETQSLSCTSGEGLPPMGTNFEQLLPAVIVEQLSTYRVALHQWAEVALENKTQEEKDAFATEVLPGHVIKAINHLVGKWIDARDEIQQEADDMKAWYRAQRDDPKLTQADVLKEIWAELPKHTDKPLPPLDEEILAELAQEPAVVEGEFKDPWGTADKLYKSEAIDAFGTKFLLGIHETIPEAQKAFEDWNAEYVAAEVDMRKELAQWSKAQQAMVDKDTSGSERIKEAMEEGRR